MSEIPREIYTKVFYLKLNGLSDVYVGRAYHKVEVVMYLSLIHI